MARQIEIHALSRTVLAVATVNTIVGDWAAYIDSVSGKSHATEAQKVADEGAKLSYEMAKLLFPHLDEEYRWRD
jgi:hypothetical protein